MPHLEIQPAGDGSATLFVPELDEHYHPKGSHPPTAAGNRIHRRSPRRPHWRQARDVAG